MWPYHEATQLQHCLLLQLFRVFHKHLLQVSAQAVHHHEPVPARKRYILRAQVKVSVTVFIAILMSSTHQSIPSSIMFGESRAPVGWDPQKIKSFDSLPFAD